MPRSFMIFIAAFLSLNAAFGRVPLPSNVPTVILVQLRMEQSRVNALMQHHETNMLETLKVDREKVMSAMIADFTDHFKFCTVYYFMDTAFEAVKKKQFDGVLLNADLSVATNSPLNSSSTNYLVVCYGKPVMQRPSEEVVEDSVALKRTFDTPNGDGLIICDDMLRQVSYLYKVEFDELYIRKHFDKKYYYKSKEFKLEYFPFATLFNEKITKDPAHIPITRIWHPG